MKISCFTHRVLTRFMRVFFYLLFQPLAWSYDLVAWLVSWGRWQDWVLTVMPYLRGPRVLELGHGPGHLQLALRKESISTFGIDASPQMCQQASRRIKKQRIIPHISNGYTQNLPFRNGCFDQIVATFPTEYIYAPETLQEIHRTLKVGSSLIVLPTAWITGRGLLDRGAAALFRVTGQAPEWDPIWLVPFAEAGFEPEFEMITSKSWSVVIISAYKKD